MTPGTSTEKRTRRDASRIADFLMFTQRSFLLNLSEELNKKSLSIAQFFLLGYLAKEDYLTMTEVSKKMSQSTAAATGGIDRLEKLGYVMRIAASDNHRQVMVQITRKGIDLLENAREDLVENLIEATVDMDIPVYNASITAHENLTEENESPLVSAVNRGLPKEFWSEFRALSENLERGELGDDENSRLIEMSDQVEKADADRLSAAAKLAERRGVLLEEIIDQYQISEPAH